MLPGDEDAGGLSTARRSRRSPSGSRIRGGSRFTGESALVPHITQPSRSRSKALDLPARTRLKRRTVAIHDSGSERRTRHVPAARSPILSGAVIDELVVPRHDPPAHVTSSSGSSKTARSHIRHWLPGGIAAYPSRAARSTLSQAATGTVGQCRIGACQVRQGWDQLPRSHPCAGVRPPIGRACRAGY